MWRCESPAKLSVSSIVAAVLADDALPRRVGLQQYRVHSHRLTFEQSPFLHHPQHELKHLAPPGSLSTSVGKRSPIFVRRLVNRFQTQEHLQRQTVVTPPGDPTLRINSLEVTGEQPPKVPTRRNRATLTLGIKLLAQPLNPTIKPPRSSELSFS